MAVDETRRWNADVKNGSTNENANGMVVVVRGEIANLQCNPMSWRETNMNTLEQDDEKILIC